LGFLIAGCAAGLVILLGSLGLLAGFLQGHRLLGNLALRALAVHALRLQLAQPVHAAVEGVAKLVALGPKEGAETGGAGRDRGAGPGIVTQRAGHALACKLAFTVTFSVR